MIKYFSIYGRDTRREFWILQLIQISWFYFVVKITTPNKFWELEVPLIYFWVPWFFGCYFGLASLVRRYRDAGCSLWGLLLLPIPILQIYVAYVAGFKSSIPANNSGVSQIEADTPNSVLRPKER